MKFDCLTDLAEGQLAQQGQAEHDHASHPEEEDVVAGLQQMPRVVGVQVRCLKQNGTTILYREGGNPPFFNPFLTDV